VKTKIQNFEKKVKEVRFFGKKKFFLHYFIVLIKPFNTPFDFFSISNSFKDIRLER